MRKILSSRDPSRPEPHQDRRMVPALLMGSGTHATTCGVNVYVYQRAGKYLARGRYQGRMFGQTLGTSEVEAAAALRRILTSIEDGSYIRPSEARKRPLSDGRVPRLTLRELTDAFLAEKRSVKGLKTATTYRSRLRPVLDFAEQSNSHKRWPLAQDIDRDFVVALRSFLYAVPITRNGKAGGAKKMISARQVVNILECFRGMLAWARQAEIRKLPVSWPNPLTPELVGSAPAKDPLRIDKLPLPTRIKLIERMDLWQLCQLSLSVLLPLRPGEAVGLTVSDVRFDKGWLVIGTRFGGGDFTKGKTSFVLPFPDELRPILSACIGSRREGPLLRSRKAFEEPSKIRPVASAEELERLYQATLNGAPRKDVGTEQDRKRIFRKILKKLGGASEGRLAAEFKKLLGAIGSLGTTLYTLRGSITTAMERAKIPPLELRYLTGHSTNDILNEYVTLEPVAAMGVYFGTVRPLLEAVTRRASALGIITG